MFKQAIKASMIEGGKEHKETWEEPYDHKKKGKLGETHEDRIRDNNTMRGSFLPKVDIKKFDGTNVKTWLSQFEQYFMLHQVPQDKKVALAALHMENE